LRSVIVKLLSEAPEEAVQADADTGRAQAQLAADRFRVELGDVAQANQGPIPVVEVSHGIGEIDES
jgi:hypothetical protein